jgi:hypothetical protein
MSPFRNALRTSVRCAGRAEDTRSENVSPASAGGPVKDTRRLQGLALQRHHYLPQTVRSGSRAWHESCPDAPREGPASAGPERGAADTGFRWWPVPVPLGGFGRRGVLGSAPPAASATGESFQGQAGRRDRLRRPWSRPTLRSKARPGATDGRGREPAARVVGGRRRFGVTGHGRRHLGAVGHPGHLPSRCPEGPPAARHRKASFGSLEVTAARWGRQTGTRTPGPGNHCARAQQGRGRVRAPPSGSRGDHAPGRSAGSPAGRTAFVATARVHRMTAGHEQGRAATHLGATRRGPACCPTPTETTATAVRGPTRFGAAARDGTEPPGSKDRRADHRSVARCFGAPRQPAAPTRGPWVPCRTRFPRHRKIEGKVGARRGKSTERLVNGRGAATSRASARGEVNAGRSGTSSSDTAAARPAAGRTLGSLPAAARATAEVPRPARERWFTSTVRFGVPAAGTNPLEASPEGAADPSQGARASVRTPANGTWTPVQGLATKGAPRSPTTGEASTGGHALLLRQRDTTRRRGLRCPDRAERRPVAGPQGSGPEDRRRSAHRGRRDRHGSPGRPHHHASARRRGPLEEPCRLGERASRATRTNGLRPGRPGGGTADGVTRQGGRRTTWPAGPADHRTRQQGLASARRWGR